MKFRAYREDDQQNDKFEVTELHRETEAAIGKKMDFPALTDHPVLRAEVAEKDGRIAGGFYLESVPEVVFFGRDAEATISAIRHAPETLKKLKECGFRIVRIEVPRSLDAVDAAMIERALDAAGFKETDSEYRHYMIDLRPGGTLG